MSCRTAPDRAIGLTAYPVEDTGLTTPRPECSSACGRARDTTAVDDLADLVRDVLHMREHYTAGGVHVALSWRRRRRGSGRTRTAA
ncbi:hypothetical protein [Streptomyces sp. SGAir0957]